MKTRKIKAFDIRPEHLFELFKKASGVVMNVEGLPEDAQFRGFCHSHEKNCIVMFIESSEFEEVLECERCPSGVLTITINRDEQPGPIYMDPQYVDEQGKING